MKKPLLMIFAAVLLCCPVFAEILFLKNGRKVEGKIIKEDDTNLVFRTNSGMQITYKKSDIKKIDREHVSAEDVYTNKLKEMDNQSAEDHFQMAGWCKENLSNKKAREHWQKAIEIDPDHEGARTALGFTNYKGKWLTKKELEVVKAREAEEYASDAESQAMRDKGYEKFNGDWVPKEDIPHLEKGEVKYGDKWMTPEEMDIIKKNSEIKEVTGKSDLEEKTGLATSKHENYRFYVETTMGAEFNKKTMADLIKAYEHCIEIFDLDPASSIWSRKAKFLNFEKKKDAVAVYNKTINTSGKKDWFSNRMQKSPKAIMAEKLIALSYRDDQIQALYNSNLHKMGQMIMTWIYGTKQPHPWVWESFGSYIEDYLTNMAIVYTTTNQGSVGSGVERAKELGGARSLVKSWVLEDKDPKIKQFCTRMLNDLKGKEILKTVVVYYYMIERDKKKFQKFVRKIKRTEKGVKPQENVFVEVWGQNLDEFEDAFSNWVRNLDVPLPEDEDEEDDDDDDDDDDFLD
ncbi:LA_0442/LA_0875 N-terminal domain-containing protein [Planctomycetota bacterium]